MEENGVRCCGMMSCSFDNHFSSALGRAFARWLVVGLDGGMEGFEGSGDGAVAVTFYFFGGRWEFGVGYTDLHGMVWDG